MELFSKMNIDECKNELQKYTKKIKYFSNFYGKVNGYSFWISHHDLLTRYSPPKFKGKLIEIENGTLVQGEFDPKIRESMIGKIGVAYFVLLGAIFIILVLLNLFIGRNNIKGEDKVVLLISFPILTVIYIFVKTTIKHQVIEDKKAIIELLKHKLQAQNMQP